MELSMRTEHLWPRCMSPNSGTDSLEFSAEHARKEWGLSKSLWSPSRHGHPTSTSKTSDPSSVLWVLSCTCAKDARVTWRREHERTHSHEQTLYFTIKIIPGLHFLRYASHWSPSRSTKKLFHDQVRSLMAAHNIHNILKALESLFTQPLTQWAGYLPV